MVVPAPIACAAQNGNVTAVEAWLNEGGDVNDCDELNDNLLRPRDASEVEPARPRPSRHRIHRQDRRQRHRLEDPIVLERNLDMRASRAALRARETGFQAPSGYVTQVDD